VRVKEKTEKFADICLAEGCFASAKDTGYWFLDA
jgi:hypothetical protein